MDDIKKKKIVTGIVIVCVIVLIALTTLAGFITNILWFSDIEYLSVYLKQLFTQLAIGIPLFLILFLVGALYLKAISNGYFKRLIVSEEKLGALGQRRLRFGLAALSSLIITAVAVNTMWFTSLQFINSTSFGIEDPIFFHDVSFYTFNLDFVNGLNNNPVIVQVHTVFTAQHSSLAKFG